MVSNDAAALQLALKNGRTVASNGPQLALQVEQRNPGDTLTLPQGGKRVHYRAALRSPVAIDHLEIVHNGRLVAAHRFGKVRTQADIEGDLTVRESGWLVLRAWNEGADPLIFDLYPYATTSPIYLDVGGKAPQSPADAAYFVQWMDRVISAADARTDYNDAREKQDTLVYLQKARAVYAQKLPTPPQAPAARSIAHPRDCNNSSLGCCAVISTAVRKPVANPVAICGRRAAATAVPW